MNPQAQQTPETTTDVSSTPSSSRRSLSSATPPNSPYAGCLALLRRPARWALIAAALYLVGLLFWESRAALVPFIIGAILIYVLLPLVNRLNKHMPRWAAILLVYLGSLLLLIGLAAYVVPLLVFQTRELIGNIPSYSMDELQGQSEEFLTWYYDKVPESVREPLEESITTAYETQKSKLTSYVSQFGTFLFNRVMQIINTLIFLLGLVIVPVWMFHVLNQNDAGYRVLNRMLPSWIRLDFWSLIRIIDSVLSSYVRGQILLGVAVGSAAGLGLWVLNLFGLKVNYILLLSVVAGLTELIPIIGPIIGAIPAIIIGLFDSPTTALAVLAVYASIQMLENAVLVPRIIGDSVDIHPAVLILLMVIASQIFGLLGVLLVAPMAAIARDIFLYLHRRLGGQPVTADALVYYVDDPAPANQTTPSPPPDTADPRATGPDQRPAQSE